MSEINNPHDKFVREIFQSQAEAVAFFSKTLPPEVLDIIEIEKLELRESSFISEELKEHHTDLLYTVPLRSGKKAQILTLFEHKSYLDKAIYIQLLGYLREIYRYQWKNEGKLSVVIPFVFYHGEEKWTLGDEFLTQFELKAEEKSILERFLPNFQIDLFFLEAAKIDTWFDNITLRIFLHIIQRIRAPESDFYRDIERPLSLLEEILEEPKRVEILRKMLIYLSGTRENDFKNFAKSLERVKLLKYEDLVMTIAENLKNEGRLEGKLEGKLEKALEDARKILEKGYALKDALEITGLSEKDLKEHGII